MKVEASDEAHVMKVDADEQPIHEAPYDENGGWWTAYKWRMYDESGGWWIAKKWGGYDEDGGWWKVSSNYAPHVSRRHDRHVGELEKQSRASSHLIGWAVAALCTRRCGRRSGPSIAEGVPKAEVSLQK